MSDSKPTLNKSFIIDIQGKQFVKYEGLLDMAHQIGLSKLAIVILQYPSTDNDNTAICRATATTKDGFVFSDIGDANKSNTSKMVSSHLIRMASTRAKGRALRDMCNIGICCAEELGDTNNGNSNGNGNNHSTQAAAKNSTANTANKTSAKQLSLEELNENLDKLCEIKLLAPINAACVSAGLQKYAGSVNLADAIKDTYFKKTGLKTNTLAIFTDKVNSDTAAIALKLFKLLAPCSEAA